MSATVEQRLSEAFADVRATVVESPDLFARVERSVEEAAARRRLHRRLAAGVVAFVVVNAALAAVLSERREGRLTVPWWVIELITNIVLVAIAIALGPFIKRFGRSYAADVFRANPRTGKSYLVLTDVAYYLIFTAYILFTMRFVEPDDWVDAPGVQLRYEVARVGGILLIMGVLHTANVVALPVIGALLANGSRKRDPDAGPARSAASPPLGPGTWLLRVEPVPPPPDTPREE